MPKLKFRCAIISESGKVMSKNCDTRNEVDTFILENNARRFRIKDNELDKVVETESGVVENMRRLA